MSADFYFDRVVKSRKERRCAASFATIPAGEPHIYYAGKSEGDFWTARIHEKVHPIYDRRHRRAWKENQYMEGLNFDDFLEDILECEDDPNRQADFDVVSALPGVPEWFARRFNETNNPSHP